MKKYLFILFSFCAFQLSAQDYLQKKDNTKLDVRIVNVTPTDVTYKPFNDSTAAPITISKKELSFIIREEGGLEPLSDKPPVPPTKESADSILKIARAAKRAEFGKIIRHKNTLFVNLLEPVNSCVGFSYFREFFKTRLMIHIPVSLGFGKPGMSNSFNDIMKRSYEGITNMRIEKKAFDVGLGLYVNTSDYEPMSYFIGPLVRYSQYSGKYFVGTTDVFIEKTFTADQITLSLNNGILWRVKPRLNILVYDNIGTILSTVFTENDPGKLSSAQYSNKGLSTIVFNFGINIGFRF